MDNLIQNTNGSRGGLAAPFLSRVRIDNYKSIGKCDVALGSLTVLVGRNGSGKSNFLDALRFVVDGLQTSLDHAIKSRGGVDAVRRRSTGHPAAAGALMDALREAASHTQVVVTSHSPDLVEQINPDSDTLLAAQSLNEQESVSRSSLDLTWAAWPAADFQRA
ncbi:MAG TPA: AAA family ATPase [Pirellulales bacterium]|nr:AAA family ATPase [Pirellulales bacterium]